MMPREASERLQVGRLAMIGQNDIGGPLDRVGCRLEDIATGHRLPLGQSAGPGHAPNRLQLWYLCATARGRPLLRGWPRLRALGQGWASKNPTIATRPSSPRPWPTRFETQEFGCLIVDPQEVNSACQIKPIGKAGPRLVAKARPGAGQ